MDYYSTLGVSKNASDKELKQAYKKASMQHHPDRGGDEAKFKQINEAYSTLKDPQKRGMYDHQQNGGGQAFNFNQQNQSGFEEVMRQANAQYGGGNPFGGSPFQDIFGKQHHQHQSRTPRNRDITLEAKIELSDVLTGKNLIIQYALSNRNLETVNVEVPAGAREGDTINYQGLGDNGDPRFPRGDLHVKIRVRKHSNWARDGDNLIAKIGTNLFDFLTGGVIIVKTLDSKEIKVSIPQGTHPGQVFNIPGYGIPNLRTGKRGNVYVTVNANIPKITDTHLLNKIAQLKNELKDL
jgi:curved DNA-binding protein